MNLRLLTFFVLLGCLGCSGCTLPVSKQPLTDAESSTLDERLVGEWEAITADAERTPLLLERWPEHPNVLLARNPREPETPPLPIYTTTLDDKCYLSAPVEPEPGKPFVIIQYELNAAHDEVQFFVLNPRRLANAIEDGELKGRVERSPPPPDPNRGQAGSEFEEILLTDEPAEIAAFIRKHEAECFVREQPLVKLQRTAAAR